MSQSPTDAATPVVSAFYDRFPFPGDPLQDGPPPGYNWRWNLRSVHQAVFGVSKPPLSSAPPLRILDAGCGTGVTSDYLCHSNPGADVLAVDISAGALDVARERLRRSGAAEVVSSLRQEQRSLLDLTGEGAFDYINSVGVLHHLDDPSAGLKALGDRLAPHGLLHLFLYADAGRWEIHRVQRALTQLSVGTGPEGLALGRQLFEVLPADNRLRRHHEQRWSVDCAADPNFADMYLHPQETSYNLRGLLNYLDASGLHFAGFSNPGVWDPARLLQGELLERARSLPQLDQWLLVEELDPEISHFEFFVSPAPVSCKRWDDDHELLAACGERQPCVWGWPSTSMLGPDLEPLSIEPEALELLKAVDQQPQTPLGTLGFGEETAALARQLLNLRLLLLIPAPD